MLCYLFMEKIETSLSFTWYTNPIQRTQVILNRNMTSIDLSEEVLAEIQEKAVLAAADKTGMEANMSQKESVRLFMEAVASLAADVARMQGRDEVTAADVRIASTALRQVMTNRQVMTKQ